MLPFPPHHFFNVRELTTYPKQPPSDENSGTLDMEPESTTLPPKQLEYQAALSHLLADWQADIVSIKLNPPLPDLRQQALDVLCSCSLKTLAPLTNNQDLTQGRTSRNYSLLSLFPSYKKDTRHTPN
jgi:hypothetical protein